MIEINLRDAQECVKAMICTGQSAILMGSPGIGKTEVLKSVAKRYVMGFLCYEASSLDPTDVRGLMIPKGDKSYYTKSPLMPDVKKHGEEGIIVIDELPSGLPATQVSLHPLFHPNERRLGNDRIPDGWTPMATGNYAADGAGAHSLLSALSDRVAILNVVEDVEVWKEDFALAGEAVDEGPLEKVEIPDRIHPIVIGYLNFRKDHFSTFKDRNKGECGKTFATPRSHVAASRVLHYADAVNMGDAPLLACLAGCLGDGVATEVVAFRKTYRELPSPKKIIQGENIIPKEESILFALCSALVAEVETITSPKQKGAMPLQRVISRLVEYSMKLDAEFGGLLIRDLFRAQSKKYKPNITSAPLWVKAAERYF